MRVGVSALTKAAAALTVVAQIVMTFTKTWLPAYIHSHDRNAVAVALRVFSAKQRAAIVNGREATDPSGVRGFAASKDLGPGEAVVIMPRERMVCMSQVLSTEAGCWNAMAAAVCGNAHPRQIAKCEASLRTVLFALHLGARKQAARSDSRDDLGRYFYSMPRFDSENDMWYAARSESAVIFDALAPSKLGCMLSAYQRTEAAVTGIIFSQLAEPPLQRACKNVVWAEELQIHATGGDLNAALHRNYQYGEALIRTRSFENSPQRGPLGGGDGRDGEPPRSESPPSPTVDKCLVPQADLLNHMQDTNTVRACMRASCQSASCIYECFTTFVVGGVTVCLYCLSAACCLCRRDFVRCAAYCSLLAAVCCVRAMYFRLPGPWCSFTR
jgi:hypothetical protein